MDKKDLVRLVSTDMSVPKAKAEQAVDTVVDYIALALLNGEVVHVAGLGIFASRRVAARKGRNPKTGEPMDIPASTKVAFKPAKYIRDSLNAASE